MKKLSIATFVLSAALAGVTFAAPPVPPIPPVPSVPPTPAAPLAPPAPPAPPAPGSTTAFLVSRDEEFGGNRDLGNKLRLSPLALNITLRGGNLGTPTGSEMDDFVDQLRWRLPGRTAVLISARLSTYVPLGDEALLSCDLFAWSPLPLANDTLNSEEISRLATAGLQSLIDRTAAEAGKDIPGAVASLSQALSPQRQLASDTDEPSLARESEALADERRKLEVERREKAARRQALEAGIEQERADALKRTNADPLVGQIEDMVNARDAELNAIREKFGQNSQAMKEAQANLDNAVKRLAEARNRLVERIKTSDVITTKPTLLNKLVEELRLTVIEEMRITNQLQATEERRAFLRRQLSSQQMLRNAVEENEKEAPKLLRRKVLLQLKEVRKVE